jgi:hypothetical protein
MWSYSKWLFGAFLAFSVLSIISISFRWTVIMGLFFASGAGSCVSIMAKMPVLDVSLSGELDAYLRRILTRVALGVSASLIGCALLGWGIIQVSIDHKTFKDALDTCLRGSSISSFDLNHLVVIAVAMLLGFSERALASIEQQVFGVPKKTRKPRF